MRVRYTLRAFDDRESICDYLEKRSQTGARTVKRAVINAIRSLASQPRLGQLTSKHSVYELVVPRRPYKIYYSLDRDEVWILHIRHTSRQSGSEIG